MNTILLNLIEKVSKQTGVELRVEKLNINGLEAIFIDGEAHIMVGDYERDLAFIDGLFVGLTHIKKHE